MEYIYLPTETGTSQLIGLYKNNRFYAVHTDHLGTPRSVTDDTNRVVWQWAYSAFGDNKPTGILKATTNPKAAITNQPKLLTATSPSFAVNLRFPGQYWDDESKLSYNINRNYQPNQGRYTQPDPIGLEGGWNRFAYVDENPLNFLDDDGLAKKEPGPKLPTIPPLSVVGGRSFKPSDAFTPIPFPPPFSRCPLNGSATTAPTLPAKQIASGNGVSVEQYYRSGDHPPAHAHVVGGGGTVKIGPNGKPISGEDELSSAQRAVVEQNKSAIRKALNKIGRWLDYNE